MVLDLVARRRAVLAGIVTSLAVLLGGGAVVHFRAERSWTAMQQAVRTLQTEWDGRAHRREPLWGEATADRAHEHYQRAMAAAKELERDHHGALVKLLARSDAQVAAELELRKAWQPVLGPLRDGARAANVKPKVSPDSDPEEQVANLLAARWVANAAMFEARVLRHEGRHVDAVRRSLDAATFGADMMRDAVLINQMIGVAVIAIATDKAWGDEALAAIAPEALEALAAGLERLDASLPETLDLTSELLLCAWALQNTGSDEQWMPSAWRFGFSTRWMISEAFVDYAAIADELAGASVSPWPERQAMFTLATEEALRSPNPLASVVIPHLSSAESHCRMTIATLRLLRMAVDLHRGRDLPPLRDPLGDGPLLVHREENGVRLRSAGSTDQRLLERFVAR